MKAKKSLAKKSLAKKSLLPPVLRRTAWWSIFGGLTVRAAQRLRAVTAQTPPVADDEGTAKWSDLSL